MLFDIIDHWNAAQQPELANDIRKTARDNLATGHAQEVYQRRIRGCSQPDPAVVINEALEIQIPQDVRDQINQLPADQRGQIQNALNAAGNPNLWLSSNAARALLGGVGAVSLRWLWDWYQNWRVGGAPGAIPPVAPGGPQPGQASGGRLPTEAELAAEAAHRKQIEDLRNHIFLDEQEIKAAHGQINQLEQTIKKQQQELDQEKSARSKCQEQLLALQTAPKEKEEIQPGLPQEEKKEEQAEQAAESTPSAYGRYVMQYKDKIVAGYPRVIQKYKDALAEPTLDNLIKADKQLVHLQRTMSYPELITVVENQPAIRKELVEDDFYPIKNLEAKSSELIDRIVSMATAQAEEIKKNQDAFANSIAKLMAAKETAVTQDTVHEYTDMSVKIKNAFEKLQQSIKTLLESYAGLTSKPFDTPHGKELTKKLADLRTAIRGNESLLSQLRKRTAQK